jgi:hypothetical protein
VAVLAPDDPAAGDGTVPAYGLARRFGAGVAHGLHAAAAASPACPLTATDHHHVRRVQVDLTGLTDSAREALTAAARAPDDPARTAALHQALLPHGAQPCAVAGRTTTVVRTRAGTGTAAYVVDEITVCVACRLVRDPEARRLLAVAVAADDPGDARTAAFLIRLVGAAAPDAVLALCGYARVAMRGAVVLAAPPRLDDPPGRSPAGRSRAEARR